MLVERRVVHAGGEQGEPGLFPAVGRQFQQGLLEQPAVVLNFLDAGIAVQAAQAGLGGLAVGNHVRNAGGHAQVVLQHAEAVVGPHYVGAADGDPSALRRGESAHLRAIVGTPVHDLGGNDPVGHDTRVAVHVLQKQVQGFQPLGQSGVQKVPLGFGQQAGDAVHGDDALFGFFIAVHGEGDAFVGEGPGDPFLDAGQLLVRKIDQSIAQPPAVGARRAVRQEHLIKDALVEVVVPESVRRRRAHC